MNTHSWGLVIFTDGAARGNPGPGGWGSIIIDQYTDTVTELGAAKNPTTNNEMELAAVVHALEFIQNNILSHNLSLEIQQEPYSVDSAVSHKHPPHVRIFLDSRYVYQGATAWMCGWAKNDWIKKDKEPVLHTALWKRLYQTITTLSDNVTLHWHHIPGHSAIVGNERADSIATQYADTGKADVYHGSLDQYSIQDILKIPTKQELVTIKEKKKTRKKSGVGGYYISVVDGVLQHHDIWKNCEDRVKGTKGAKYKKVMDEDEERDVLRGWGM
jgi:ribonuclease HI